MARPVLILGAQPRMVVAIARALARHRIPVLVAAISYWEYRIPSRAIYRFVSLPDYEAVPSSFVEALDALLESENVEVLIPASDEALKAIAPHYVWLASRVRVSSPAPSIVENVLDKARTQEIAAQCGIPIPATYTLPDLDALEENSGNLRFPLLAKPASKAETNVAYLPIRLFHNLEPLREAYRNDPCFGKRFLLQEYCSGEDVGLAVLMHSGEPIALFQYRGLKTLPYQGGVSVLTCSEPLNPPLAEYAVTLLRALRWEGIAQIDFRHDPTNGKTVLLEVNGRFWGSLAAAVYAGMDFPYYVWQAAQGLPPTVAAGYRYGLRLRWFAGDLRRLLSLLRSQEGNTTSSHVRWRETGRFLRDFCPPTRDMLWAWNDPLPAFWETGVTLKRLVGPHIPAWARRRAGTHSHETI